MHSKIYVVTGATSGIGLAVAKEFSKEGIVVLVGRNEEYGSRVCQELVDDCAQAVFLKCDVTSKDEIGRVAEYIEKTYGRVDVLFNNAGIMLQPKEIERLETEEWNSTFAVNVEGVLWMTAALKKMIIDSKGCIINNASIAGMHSYVAGRSYAYSASKAAVIQLSRQMAKNYAEDGVRVNCICPGIIDTKILGDRDRKVYAERVPLGYVGRPEQVADLVSFLASDRASYITGAVIPIDGGATL